MICRRYINALSLIDSELGVGSLIDCGAMNCCYADADNDVITDASEPGSLQPAASSASSDVVSTATASQQHQQPHSDDRLTGQTSPGIITYIKTFSER